jgi:peroxiredoxin
MLTVLALLAINHNMFANSQETEGSELIGSEAPEFAGLTWINSDPVTMKSLRGRPVLIRFWNRECDMCFASAPVFNEMQSRYGSKGLAVIGIHHRKSERDDTVAEVKATASKLKFSFPIAIDNRWTTVNKYWMNKKRSMTSASFLIDKKGRFVWIHPGGTLSKGSSAAKQLDAEIKKQL